MSRVRIPDDKKALRQALDDIDGATNEDISQHRERVESVGHSHSIQYMQDGGGARLDCLEYALKIPTDLIGVAVTFSSIIDGFLATLPKILNEIPAPEASTGRVVLYFKDGEPKHVGKVIEGTRVVSKWGKNPVYQHEISEVPAS
jgi:hypothetical protein